MFYIRHLESNLQKRERFMSDAAYYSLIPEQGLCLIDDVIVNLGKAAVIRKTGGKTLIYYAGSAQPVELPADVFDQIREEAFAMEDPDDDDDEYDDDDGEEDD